MSKLREQIEMPVFFDPRMVCLQSLPSPSAAKPAQAVESWLAAGLAIKVESFEPVSRELMALAHDPRHIKNIFEMKTSNGFGKKSARVNDTLAWTSGSFLAAARWAIEKSGIACSPTSGFHHAGWDFSHGYCTFNGLMIAAATLRSEGYRDPIGVLDFDYHFGDGTADIIGRGIGARMRHITAETGYSMEAEAFFKELPEMLESFVGCGVLFYQAGADCHESDPYGGFLTTEQMRRRDRAVFEFCACEGIPVAWNLAGGYQQERLADGSVSIGATLRLHDQTMEESLAAIGAGVGGRAL